MDPLDEDEQTSLESDESQDEDTTWIQWFSGLKGNELFCEVRGPSCRCLER